MKIRPPKILETKRLVLRPFKLEDAEQLINLNIEDTWNFKNLKQAQDWIKKSIDKNAYVLAIILKDGNKLIGNVGMCHFDWFDFRAGELGYGLNKKFHGKGYTPEACRVLIDYCFKKYKFVKICADTDDNNKASQRVLEKLGFKLEGIIRKRRIVHGRWTDEWDYGLLRTEWKQ